MRVLNTVAISFVTIILTSCGGGGGGGGSSSHGVRILHSAIDAAPADLTSSGSPGIVLQSGAFGDQPGYVELPKGQQNLTLAIRSAGGTFTVPVTVAGDEKRSLILVERSNSLSFGANILDDLPPDVDSSNVAVRIVNGVRGAGIIVPSINGTAQPGVLPAEGGGYITVPAGTLSLQAKNSSRTVYSGSLNLVGGSAYTILLAGEAGYFVTSRLFAD